MSHNNSNLRQFDPMASPRLTQTQAPTVNNPSLTQDQLQFLQRQGFSSGMIRAFVALKKSSPVRIWILDNSTSMNVSDAHILRNRQNCNTTRWEELKECVAYHADFAVRFQLPSRYSLLNNPGSVPQYFSIAQTGSLAQEQQVMNRLLSQVIPAGPTPLAAQLRILRDYIVSIAPELRAKNQTVPIIVATQGLPSNSRGETSHETVVEFTNVLRSFEKPFPVWIVLRICSDDETAMMFYNSLDSQLNLDLDVLDDIYGEALEVFLRNPWLTYSLALHRFRESGFPVPVLDAIDERALTLPELWQFCSFLFDVKIPDPVTNWLAFLKTLEACLIREQLQWNPVTKTMMPWINVAYLNTIYDRRQAVYSSPVGAPPPRSQQVPSKKVEQQQFRSTPVYSVTPETPTAAKAALPLGQAMQSRPKDTSQLNDAVNKLWAKQPPMYSVTKPIAILLDTVSSTFPLVEQHEYFQNKYHPFAKEALATGNAAVLKRAVRKMRLFLHPDKLPNEFNNLQTALCKVLWDTISEAWTTFQEQK